MEWGQDLEEDILYKNSILDSADVPTQPEVLFQWHSCDMTTKHTTASPPASPTLLRYLIWSQVN